MLETVVHRQTLGIEKLLCGKCEELANDFESIDEYVCIISNTPFRAVVETLLLLIRMTFTQSSNEHSVQVVACFGELCCFAFHLIDDV